MVEFNISVKKSKLVMIFRKTLNKMGKCGIFFLSFEYRCWRNAQQKYIVIAARVLFMGQLQDCGGAYWSH